LQEDLKPVILKTLLKEFSINATQLAEKLEVTAGMISKLSSGKSDLNVPYQIAIATIFGIKDYKSLWSIKLSKSDEIVNRIKELQAETSAKLIKTPVEEAINQLKLKPLKNKSGQKGKFVYSFHSYKTKKKDEVEADYHIWKSILYFDEVKREIFLDDYETFNDRQETIKCRVKIFEASTVINLNYLNSVSTRGFDKIFIKNEHIRDDIFLGMFHTLTYTTFELVSFIVLFSDRELDDQQVKMVLKSKEASSLILSDDFFVRAIESEQSSRQEK
jgi:transcriptional regulator with XRE-family HTH domain